MLLNKLKTTAVVFMLVGLLAVGLGLAAQLLPAWADAQPQVGVAPPAQKPDAKTPPPEKTPPKTDQDLILGRWRPIRAEDGGRLVPERELQGALLMFTKEKALFRFGGTDEDVFTYKLDPSKSPKWIDFSKGDKTVRTAIYELKGDTLKLVIDETGEKGRPTEFVSQAGTVNDLFITFERLPEKVELKVAPDKENVVGSRLEGDWQLDAALSKRLTDGQSEGGRAISFKSDSSVTAKIPAKFGDVLTKKRIYLAGIMTFKGDQPREHVFILIELSGNPHVVWFRERGGDPLGDTESFNVMLAVAADRQHDLLFIGGDFNNQPFSAYSRVKADKE